MVILSGEALVVIVGPDFAVGRTVTFSEKAGAACACPDCHRDGFGFIRECDECLIAWHSDRCRHASPKCPRCGEATE